MTVQSSFLNIRRSFSVLISAAVLFPLPSNTSWASCGDTVAIKRWMEYERNLADMLVIESESFRHPWSEEFFLSSLIKGRFVQGKVVEVNGKTVGFIIFETFKNTIQILNLAVKPEYRRKGIGEELVKEVQKDLGSKGKDRIVVELNETNDAALELFGKRSFKAVSANSGETKAGHKIYLLSYRNPRSKGKGNIDFLSGVIKDTTPRSILDADIAKISEESSASYENDPRYHQFQRERIEKMKTLQGLLDAERTGNVGHDERYSIGELQSRINIIVETNRHLDITAAMLKYEKITPDEAKRLYDNILEWTYE